MKIDNFLAELKRRNVYKVAVAYAVVAWLLIQAASILLPAFDAPQWVIKAFILVIIFGFPVALILSWAFEITPEGIKLESEISPNESIKRRTGRKIVGITVVLAVIAAGLLAFFFGPNRLRLQQLQRQLPAIRSPFWHSPISATTREANIFQMESVRSC